MGLEELLAVVGTIVSGIGAFMRDTLIVGIGATVIGIALIAAWMIAG